MTAMDKKTLTHSLLLLLTALIWGVAFVAQTEGGDALGPYTFTSVRFFMGALVLRPVIALRDRSGRSVRRPQNEAEKRLLWRGALLCGLFLFGGSMLQQLAITMGTGTGKAGFLTACYIVMVPIVGLFLGKKVPRIAILSIGMTVVGLYFLCITGEFRLQQADVLLLLCALSFTGQILMVDHFSPRVDGVRLASLQFLTTGVLAIIPMLMFELLPMGLPAWLAAFRISEGWVSLLYAGVMSCGVAYTLQILGQEGLNPTVASLLMSLECVFSALAGWAILGQLLSRRELWGCVLIFVAILLIQLPERKKKTE